MKQIKTALVTGASSGLGQATAARLQAAGYRVYGTSRARAPIPLAGAPWTMLPLDVRCEDSVDRCVDAVLGHEGRIDVLVNNAGHALVGAVEETSLDEARLQMEVNFFGALKMMQAVLPAMRDQGFGRIVNISSVSGVVAFPFLGLYGASKQALEAASEALSHELRGSGVAITLIEPDGMKTGIGFHHPAHEHPDQAPARRRLLARLVESTTSGGTDPAVLADAVLAAVESDAPPLRVVIDEMALRVIEARRMLPPEQFGALIAGMLREAEAA